MDRDAVSNPYRRSGASKNQVGSQPQPANWEADSMPDVRDTAAESQTEGDTWGSQWSRLGKGSLCVVLSKKDSPRKVSALQHIGQGKCPCPDRDSHLLGAGTTVITKSGDGGKTTMVGMECSSSILPSRSWSHKTNNNNKNSHCSHFSEACSLLGEAVMNR